VGSVPAGTVFVLGTTTITYRLVDENGNVSEVCDFTVTVIDDEAPVIDCPLAGLSGTANASCVYAFAPNLVEDDVTDNCTVFGGLTIDYRVFGPDNSVSAYFANGASFNFAVGISQIEWRVVDGAGNVATCLQAMTVSDATPPVITCAAGSPFTRNNTLDLCGYIVEGTEFDATAEDNCGSVVLTNNYNGQSSLGGVLLPVGTTIVVWTATDANGNTDECTIEIEVEDTQLPVFITCPPADITLSLAPGGCETVLTWAIPVAEDNCGIADIEQTGGPLFGATVGVGVYDIEYTAFDLSGNEAVCEFTITVEDTQGPILACPVDVTLGTDTGECTYESVGGQFNPILSVDNCPNVILEHSFTGGAPWTAGSVPAGTVFVLGTTTITYRLVDENGNVSEVCDFTVTVIDDEAPVIDCPLAGLSGTANASCVYAFAPNLVEDDVTDNCTVFGGLTIDYRVFGPDNSVSAYFANGRASTLR
jgi:hypothetical protein